LKARVRAVGIAGLLRRGRGQPSARRVPPNVRERIATLSQTTYADFNDCHFTEKLAECEGVAVSRATVRRVRRALGLPPKRRRRPRRARHRRVPEAAMGAMVQVDASPFGWFEARGPALTLVGAIDDATGAILGLTFRPHEDLHGYAEVFRQVFTGYGLPLQIYGDRINILVRNDRHWTLEEQLQGAQHPTHLGAVLQELGIGYIAAHSPQAKGRVERLWNTLQDRLVSELRLRGIATVEAANAFLPTFIAAHNRRFARAAAAPRGAWRRPPSDLDVILSCRYTRVVARDHSVRLGTRLILLPRQPGGRSWAGYRVDVRELLTGDLIVQYHDIPLARQVWHGPFTLRPRAHPSDAVRHSTPPIIRTPAQLRRQAAFVPSPRSSRPSAAHPWRRPWSRISQAPVTP
jgi:hypothetical protein